MALLRFMLWQLEIVEKSSRAFADADNSNRSPSDLTRQSIGRKTDYLFMSKKTEYELGCGECALISGVNTTNELYDSCFKMPKVMKNMAISLLSSRAILLYDLLIAGYCICISLKTRFNIYSNYIEAKIQLKTMDFSCGYVARVDSFGPVAFSKVESEICRSLPAILAVKLLMERSKMTIEQYKDQVVVGKKGITSGCIIPKFTSATTPAAGRKSQVGSSSQLP